METRIYEQYGHRGRIVRFGDVYLWVAVKLTTFGFGLEIVKGGVAAFAGPFVVAVAYRPDARKGGAA